MLIHNVTIFTNNDSNSVLHNQAVAVDETRIAEIGDESALKVKYAKAPQLDGGGRLLMPGFTNTHMHFYRMYARGLSLNRTPTNFQETEQYLWWALDKVLDEEAVYYSALIQAISAVRFGVTSMIDHHASPDACAGSLDQIEHALSEVGLRGLLCYEVSDRDGREIRDAGLAENERYIRKCVAAKSANPDHLFDGMMGLHASFTLDDDSLEKAVSIASSLNRGCHIHMLEDECDETITVEKYGRPVVERLADFGVLGPKSIAAQSSFLDDASRKLVVDSGSMLVQQARSNVNNGDGHADAFALLEQGATVGIGTDGISADLRREMLTDNLMHNRPGWIEYEQMAMKNNPAIYQRLSRQKVGRIEVDYLADIILLDYDPPTPFSGENFWSHMLFGIADAQVNTTIVNGRVLMHDKVIDHIDEKVISAESRIIAERIWKRYKG